MNPEWEALIVGINCYPGQTTLQNLNVAAQDAKNIAVHLSESGYQTFRINCLGQPTDQRGEAQINPNGIVMSHELQEALSNLLNPPQPNTLPETALFFFSGHGWRKTVDGRTEVFLATSDAFPQEQIYGVSLTWLGKEIQKSPVKRVIVWLDCCFSGELLNFKPTNKDYCFITATRSFEIGVEIVHEQGLFTKALLKGLNPNNYPDGIVNSHNLAKFIASQMAQAPQKPSIENSQRAILLTTKFPRQRFQNTCPYRSLSYFTEKSEDAKVFYGRSTLTKELISRVKNNNRFIAVLGASGSGKSSLLRAGLLYQLKLGQEIPGSDNWQYLEPFTPQEKPLKNLEAAMEKGTGDWGLGTGELGTGKEKNYNSRFQPTLAISLRIDSQAGSLEDVKPVVMVIDQFEEVFTMCNETQQQEFFEHLIKLNQNNPNLYIIIGMRSDFRSRLREYRPLTEHIDKPYINIEHLNREEIEEAIIKPADWVGLDIEGALKQQIIHDVEDYPGSLPLLQYTLTELWNEAQKQGEQFLRLETYNRIGGIEGTLEKRADAVYQSLWEPEKIVAKRLFLELTQVGETLDSRRRVYLDDLANSHHSIKILKDVSDILASEQNRLITCSVDRISEESEQSEIENPKSKILIDVVHEALIRHWKRLRDWQDEYRDAMIVEREIETQAQQWETQGKPNDLGLLLQGAKLAKAVDYLSKYGELGMLDGVAEDLIRISQQQDKKRRFSQKLTFGVVVVVAVVATLFAFESHKQKELANLREEAANIKSLLSADISATPLIQAIQLTEKNTVNQPEVIKEVYSSLYDTVQQVRERNTFKHQNPVGAVAFSPNGKTILSGSDDKTLRLWDTSGKLLRAFTGHQDSVRAVAFSPNGKTILSGSDDKTLRLWDTSGKLLRTFTGHQDLVNAVAFSRDGKYILSGSDDKTLRLWNTSGQLLRTFTGHQNPVWSVAFSPDGKTILSGSGDKTLKLWNTSGQLLRTFTGHQDSVNAVAFSPDGKTILSGSGDKTLKLWNTSGKLLRNFTGHENFVKAVAFSRDGKTILSGSADKKIILWDTSGNLLHTFTGHQDYVNGVAFSPDGKTILSGSEDKTLKLWDTSGKLLRTFKGHQNTVYGVAFSPDGNTILSGSKDGTLKLWETSGKLLHTFTGHPDSVFAVAFSPDGKYILSGSSDKTLKLWHRPENWQYVLRLGCAQLRLHPQLASPENEAAGEICRKYGGWKKIEEAHFLVRQGKALVQEKGDMDRATGKLTEAKKLDPNLNLAAWKTQLAADLIEVGEKLVKEGNVTEALTAYEKAKEVEPDLKVSAQSWNNLCWYGSLFRSAQNVMFACENAVKLAPDNLDFRDSRGVARALTEDKTGAIKDLQQFVNSSNRSKEYKAKRQAWIKDLKAGKDPFTDEVLQQLQNE